MSPPARPLPRSPLATARPWNLVAQHYEAEIVPMFAAYAEAALDLAGVAAGARIADVACGPGTLALLAADRGIEVDVLDVAPEMIARLQAAAAGRGRAAIRAVVGDGQDLPWPDASFAAAFSLFGLMYFPDRHRGYRELYRVLAPGGRAVVASWPPIDEAPVLARAIAALGEAEPSFAGPSRAALTTIAEHQAEMGRAGFTAIRVERIAPTTPFASAGAFWDHLQRTSAPMTLARMGVGDDRWRVIEAHVRASLLGAFGSGAIEVTMPAWIVAGTRA